MARDRVLEHLHPTFRGKYTQLTQILTEENLPFRLFEGFRSPLPHDRPQRPPIVPGPEDAEEKPAPQSVSGGGGKRYRVVAWRGLRLREGASQEFDIVEALPLNQVVQVLKVVGDWYLVDVEGDGIADGYCFGGYLIPEN